MCRNHMDTAAVSKTMCQFCLDRIKNRKKELNAAGKCRTHPNRKIEPGYTNCKLCLEKTKARRQNQTDNGMCVSHPMQPRYNGTVFCIKCSQRLVWQNIKKRYGLTKEKYLEECLKRSNRCDICKVECKPAGSGTKNERYNVDHDHKTEKVRGFLCHICNLLLGQFNDDKSRIENFIKNVIEYLERSDYEKLPVN